MRNKIYYYNVVAIILFIVLLMGIGTLLYLSSQVANYKAVASRTAYIDQTFIKLTHLQFAFFHTKDINYETQYTQLINDFKSRTDANMRKDLLFFTLDLPQEIKGLLDPNCYSHYLAINSIINEYITVIQKIFQHQKVLGLDHNHGLYGKLRDKVHLLEYRLKGYDNQKLLISMLTMRRHEKDFMLRGLPKYVSSLYLEMQRFQKALSRSTYKDKTILSTYANEYLQSFNSFVTFYNLIGYGQSYGQIQHSQVLRDSFSTLSQEVTALLENQMKPYESNIQVITVAMLVDAILLVILIMLSRREVEHAKERNPITGLNGNNRITEHLKKIARYNKKRTVIYFDFDYFKPFNDRFGFKTGDRIILDFATTLKSTFNQKHNFLGHIGGDDFIAILYKSSFKEALQCVKEIQKDFHNSCLKFYDPQEVEQGFIDQKDRFGESRQLPLIKVSASIVQVAKHVTINDANIISNILSLLKHSAKKEGIAAVSLL